MLEDSAKHFVEDTYAICQQIWNWLRLAVYGYIYIKYKSALFTKRIYD